jgi:hypothetical protein
MNNDRGARAWRASKERKVKRVRPTLDRTQRIEFLELVAQMASRSTFERKFNLTSADIEFYKREFDVESPDEARRLARRLRQENEDLHDIKILEETQKVREAEEVAQARLEALEAKRAADAIKPKKKIDINKIRQEDAERQRRFTEQQGKIEKPTKEWRLPFEEGRGTEEEQIDAFRRDIIYHGLAFTGKKFNVTSQQIKYEATRLGLNINWDIVRR